MDSLKTEEKRTLTEKRYRRAGVGILIVLLVGTAAPVAEASGPSFWVHTKVIETDPPTDEPLTSWLRGCIAQVSSVTYAATIFEKSYQDPGRYRPPRLACNNPIHHTVRCRVKVAKSGEITDIRMLSSSGIERVDLFACSLIRKAALFRSPPNEIPTNEGVEISFIGTDADQPPPLEIRIYNATPASIPLPNFDVRELERKGTAQSYMEIGQKYSEQNDFEAASRYFEKALSLARAEKLTPQQESALCLVMAANSYKQKDYYSALTYYRKAFTLDSSLKDNIEVRARITELTKMHTVCPPIAIPAQGSKQ